MIEVTDVSVAVDGATLLAPTTLHVASGEAIAVRGANGSGKTTLLRVLTGKLAPTTGRVRIGGEPVDDRAPAFRRRVAAGLGLPPFARDLTLLEHTTLIGTTWGRDTAQAEDNARAVFAELGLSRLASRFPHALSSGQRQLAALALVLVRPFDVLVLDEPEQRLDADRLGTVIDILHATRSRGTTLVVATHSDRIAAATDRVIELTDVAAAA